MTDAQPKRPAGMSQGDWFEAIINRAIADGKFDGVENAPDPMAGVDVDRADDHDWWLKKFCEREGLSTAPTLLALRDEALRLRGDIHRYGFETELRAAAEDVNRRIIDEELVNPAPLALASARIDVEALIAEWKARRARRP